MKPSQSHALNFWSILTTLRALETSKIGCILGNTGRVTNTAAGHSKGAIERKFKTGSNSNKNGKLMNTVFKILTILCVVGLVVGLSDIGNGMFSGLARAAGAVCFVLAFITRVLQKAEATG